MLTLSCTSANFVARARKYSGENNWGLHERATIESSRTESFDAIAKEISAAGFEAVDIWAGHCHWKHHDGAKIRDVQEACARHRLKIASYAGGLTATTLADMQQPIEFTKKLGTPIKAGGLWGSLSDAQATEAAENACNENNVRWAFENHLEKTVEEIFARMGGGKHSHIGIALDTGWCATQKLDPLEAIKQIHNRGLLLTVHLKDIVAAGAHETCAAGDGIVPCEEVCKYLKTSGWTGTICIEHEPYNRDPMPEVRTSLERARKWIG